MKITDFQGTLPKLPKKKLPPNVAVSAVNCDVSTGQLKPYKDVGQIQDIDMAGEIRSIFKCGNTWLGWAGVVDVVKAEGVNTDSRIMYTGDGYPKVTDASQAISGGVPAQYPSVAYRNGVAAPAAALTITTDEINAGAGYGSAYDTAIYCYTYVSVINSDYKQESAPSPPTPPVDILENMKATLSNFVNPADTGNNILYYRVYRAVKAASGETVFQLVPTGRDGNGEYTYDMPVAQTTFVDLDPQADPQKVYQNLSEAIQTEGWDILPDTAKGLCQYQNGILAAINGQQVLLSEIFIPYAFPQGINDADIKYSYDFAFAPVSIASFRGMLIVGTTANPFVMTGSEPAFMSKVDLPMNQACVGDMCVTEIGVFYPGKNGLVICDGIEAKPVATGTWTKEQWKALGPENLQMFYHDEKLIGFFKGNSTGFVFDFKTTNTVVDISLGTKLFYDGVIVEEEGKLYLLLKDGATYYIYEWEGSASDMSFSWEGYQHGKDRALYSLARIDGDFGGNSIILVLNVDGSDLADIEIENDDPFYLPAGHRVVDLKFKFTGAVEIDSIYLGHSWEDLYD